MSSYYMRRDGVMHGPYTAQQLLGAAKSGKLLATDEIGRSENGPWTFASKFPQLESYFPQPETEPPVIRESVFVDDPEYSTSSFQFQQQSKASVSNSVSAEPVVREGWRLSDLFDWKFRHFITPALNQWFYQLTTILWTISVFITLVAGQLRVWAYFSRQEFTEKALTVFVGIVILPLICLLGWLCVQIFIRNAFELALVLFRIEENTRPRR